MINVILYSAWRPAVLHSNYRMLLYVYLYVYLINLLQCNYGNYITTTKINEKSTH